MPSRRDFLTQFAFAASLTAARQRASFLGALDSNSVDDDTVRARLAADPLRPQFHLLPAKNWMNDPNGPIYWKGEYHMFFQYNPNAAVWGDMHWAHAVSKDMIHWRHLPVALAPTPSWDDADGCFTGSAADDRGTATIIYTGVKTVAPDRATLRDGTHNFREVQCLATSADPQLRSWTKWRQPILQPPDDPDLMGFRDPFLWRDAGTWYLGVGSGQRKRGGRILLYRSSDLRQWEYLHPLASGKWTERESINPVDSGEMWECPDFFPLGHKHVLLYSTAGKVRWETGELDPKELVFHSEKRGVLDHGAYYAQKTQLDARGNRILWGWIPETRPEAEFSASGWAGCMALPRVLSLNPNGDLEMSVAPETKSLRGKPFALPQQASPSERAVAAQQLKIENLSAEIAWQVATPQSTASQTTFVLSDQTGPWFSAQLTQDPQSSELTVNGTSLDLPPSARSSRDFRLFLDASVAELICDHAHATTTRIYRQPNGPLRLSIPDGTTTQLPSLESWPLRAISPDRLTT
jgi:beta-fructofuranosidase